MLSKVTTDPTPMMTPNMVSTVRSLLLASAISATRIVSNMFMRCLMTCGDCTIPGSAGDSAIAVRISVTDYGPGAFGMPPPPKPPC